MLQCFRITIPSYAFQNLFVVPDGRAFLDIFNEEVRIFKERVGHLTPEELLYYEDDEGEEDFAIE